MWTLRMLRQIAIFDEDEVRPEPRTHRTLNRARIREMSNYVLNNPDSYVFPPLTVSIDSHTVFEPLPGQNWLGNLRVPMDAHFVMNDGQHRCQPSPSRENLQDLSFPTVNFPVIAAGVRRIN
jgi:DNA sulfur modification protein DndB